MYHVRHIPNNSRDQNPYEPVEPYMYGHLFRLDDIKRGEWTILVETEHDQSCYVNNTTVKVTLSVVEEVSVHFNLDYSLITLFFPS